jgi:hypothetical protein
MTKPFENTPEPRFTGAYIFDTPKKMFSRGADVNTYGIYGEQPPLWDIESEYGLIYFYHTNYISGSSPIADGYYWIGRAANVAVPGSPVRLSGAPVSGGTDYAYFLVDTLTGTRTYLFSEYEVDDRFVVGDQNATIKKVRDVILVDGKLWVTRYANTTTHTPTASYANTLRAYNLPTLSLAYTSPTYTITAVIDTGFGIALWNYEDTLYTVVANTGSYTSLKTFTTSGPTNIVDTTVTTGPVQFLKIKSNKAWFSTDRIAGTQIGTVCIDLDDNSEAKLLQTAIDFNPTGAVKYLEDVLDSGEAVFVEVDLNVETEQWIVAEKNGSSINYIAYPVLHSSPQPVQSIWWFYLRTSEPDTFVYIAMTADFATTGMFKYNYASGIGEEVMGPGGLGVYPPLNYVYRVWEKTLTPGNTPLFGIVRLLKTLQTGYGDEVVVFGRFNYPSLGITNEVAVRLP